VVLYGEVQLVDSVDCLVSLLWPQTKPLLTEVELVFEQMSEHPCSCGTLLSPAVSLCSCCGCDRAIVMIKLLYFSTLWAWGEGELEVVILLFRTHWLD
jgi:hypothetical protein